MKINLNEDWHLRYEELECGRQDVEVIVIKNDGWLKTDLPCDIREPLIKCGIIKDPLEGMNCFESEWIENKSWWFKKTFFINEELLSDDVIELCFESMDYGAEVFLNGNHIGQQLSSFYPFIKDIKDKLKLGENRLLIRLTTGLETVDEEQMTRYVMTSEEERRPGRGDKRKGFLRKPQYSFGWDWNPKVSTCGIVKDVWLESHKTAAIRRVYTFVKELEPQVRLGIEVEFENFHAFTTQETDITVSFSYEGSIHNITKTDILLTSGINIIDMDIVIPDAQLWWPNGMGGQPLYSVDVNALVNGHAILYPSFHFGIRTVEMDMSKLDIGERLFAFKINGIKTFCKGANWIPADSIYSRVTDQKYETLILEAKNANFNMLRIWGGGLYERDIFYESCDKNGIMLWHDFMFACSEYPDDQEWFYNEVGKELDYQTRKLSNHSSIVLWCGNNEIHWAFDEWWPKSGCFGSKIYNFAAPAAVRKNCRYIPYWNSSPYGGLHPNGSDTGDRHHWHDCMMNEDMMKRIVPEEYDKVSAKFVSEYGYVGPNKRSTVEKYLGGSTFDINSDIWQHHNNTFEKDTVLAGIKYHYIDPEGLDIDSYLLYAGLCQGVMYSYSLEAFRYKKDCSGGLFWMYNDCWGETGWTIIDYYLTRKISYYFVKRALAPQKFILKEQNGSINVVGCNDNHEGSNVDVEYGYVWFDGCIRETKRGVIQLEANSRKVVMSFDQGVQDPKKGVHFVKAVASPEIPLATLRTCPFRELEILKTEILVERNECVNGNVNILVSSNNYAHAVHFNLQDKLKLSDDYFDLLPGEKKEITIFNVPDDFEIDSIKPVAVNW